MTKFESLHEDLKRAIANLAEVLAHDKNDIVRDSAIQRFEIAFELAWKTVKAFVEEKHNAQCISPRNCFQEAFRVGLIEYDPFWIEMTKLRNYTTHIYRESLADLVYAGLPDALRRFEALLDALKRNPN